MIAFAIQRREKEDEQTQHGAANGKLDIGFVLEAGKDALGEAHGTNEVQTHQSAEDAK